MRWRSKFISLWLCLCLSHSTLLGAAESHSRDGANLRLGCAISVAIVGLGAAAFLFTRPNTPTFVTPNPLEIRNAHDLPIKPANTDTAGALVALLLAAGGTIWAGAEIFGRTPAESTQPTIDFRASLGPDPTFLFQVVVFGSDLLGQENGRDILEELRRSSGSIETVRAIFTKHAYPLEPTQESHALAMVRYMQTGLYTSELNRKVESLERVLNDAKFAHWETLATLLSAITSETAVPHEAKEMVRDVTLRMRRFVDYLLEIIVPVEP